MGITVKIKTFKATHDLEASIKFAQGHADVLASYGIKKITSSNMEWVKNPNIYVILVESEDGSKVLGGAKLQILSEDTLLPIEEAVGHMDPRLYDLTRKYPMGKTGELCGLWNSREMSGSGLSTILVRAGVAKSGIFLARQLELRSLFALCAPWTVQMSQNCGYVIQTGVGNEGTFPYPNEEFLATVMLVEDVYKLNSANDFDKNHILNLRINPNQKFEEKSPKGKLLVEYNLSL